MSNIPVPEAVVDPQLLVKPLDIQHDTDPADDHGPARRIPHLGHAIQFFALALLCVFTCAAVAVGIITRVTGVSVQSAATDFPTVSLLAQAIGYILTLAAAAQLFPRLWEKSFLRGIEWNFLAVRRRWPWLVAGGAGLSVLIQLAESHLIHIPDHAPVERVFVTQHSAYTAALLAIVFAPIFEEIAFRGFLLPALATAYDWLSLDRTPAALQRWESSTAHTLSALVFAALLSSLSFALIHGSQISFAWGAVGFLFLVSLVLSFVRIRLHSVAASAFFHAVYNFTIFAVLYAGTGAFRHLDQFNK